MKQCTPADTSNFNFLQFCLRRNLILKRNEKNVPFVLGDICGVFLKREACSSAKLFLWLGCLSGLLCVKQECSLRLPQCEQDTEYWYKIKTRSSAGCAALWVLCPHPWKTSHNTNTGQNRSCPCFSTPGPKPTHVKEPQRSAGGPLETQWHGMFTSFDDLCVLSFNQCSYLGQCAIDHNTDPEGGTCREAVRFHQSLEGCWVRDYGPQRSRPNLGRTKPSTQGSVACAEWDFGDCCSWNIASAFPSLGNLCLNWEWHPCRTAFCWFLFASMEEKTKMNFPLIVSLSHESLSCECFFCMWQKSIVYICR